MATKERAVEQARRAAIREPEKTWAVFRVAGSWMMTSNERHVSQKGYRVTIAEWEVVHLSGGDVLEEHY